jgi:ubiquinone/menaquinone biosynthesis C-methylase UbiE
MNNYNNFDNLINKIYRFLNSNDKKNIKKLISETAGLHDLNNRMTTISQIILNYVKQLNLKKDVHRQDFIVSKILDFIKVNKPEMLSKTLKFIDIGGGNGDILSGINRKLHGIKENYVCVETKTDWVEEYEFNHNNISYEFWENNKICIPDKSFDIILCMVSLHHMTDDVILNVIYEIKRIIKENGLLLIKEHDSNSEITRDCIEWEHHLYHILDNAYKDRLVDAEEYLKHNIDNFKQKEKWQELFERNGFKLNYRANRFLDGNFIPDPKNPSNLYWDVYTVEPI